MFHTITLVSKVHKQEASSNSQASLHQQLLQYTSIQMYTWRHMEYKQNGVVYRPKSLFFSKILASDSVLGLLNIRCTAHYQWSSFCVGIIVFSSLTTALCSLKKKPKRSTRGKHWLKLADHFRVGFRSWWRSLWRCKNCRLESLETPRWWRYTSAVGFWPPARRHLFQSY